MANTKGPRFTRFALGILLTAAAIGAVLIRMKSSPVPVGAAIQQQQQRERVNTIPPAFSKVTNLKILSARIVNADTPAAGVAVEILNDSDRPVMAVDLVCGEGGVTRNGLVDADNPIVAIQPYGTTTITINFSEMTPGVPLVVNAVTYADGTEEGEDSSLKLMHAVREQRAQLKAQKQHSPEGNPNP